VALAPGGYHLMFMNLAAPLTEGETVSGELVFERAGKLAVTYEVLGIGAQGPAEGNHQH
jgi:copper(I)-binding protein